MGFPQRVLSFCREYDLLSPGDTVICAVSGGKDSVALLWCMKLLSEQIDLRVEAAHFNHCLRGEESERDEAFVRALCDRLEIPLHLGRGSVQAQGRGLEDAARRARYDFFATLNPAARIATAHTAEDNAETLLLRQLRGTGLKGLGGIAPRRGNIIRPMLRVTRREVGDFLEEWNLHHVEDSSNAEDAFLRNRLRHSVLPLLETENPRFSQNASRMALELRRDSDYLEGQAASALANLREESSLPCEGLRSLHPAICSRVLSLFLRELGLREPEAIHLEAVRNLLDSRCPSARAVLPDGLVLERRYDRIAPAESQEQIKPLPLQIPGVTELTQWRIICREAVVPDHLEWDPWGFYLPYPEEADDKLWVRSRCSGDRLSRPGGSKSLKKLMIDLRVPASLRDSLPVITGQEQLLFAAGVGVSVACKVESGAKALRIEIIKREET